MTAGILLTNAAAQPVLMHVCVQQECMQLRTADAWWEDATRWCALLLRWSSHINHLWQCIPDSVQIKMARARVLSDGVSCCCCCVCACLVCAQLL